LLMVVVVVGLCGVGAGVRACVRACVCVCVCVCDHQPLLFKFPPI
jgi:hypothetical protein